jgi:signal transduction histidine kinase
MATPELQLERKLDALFRVNNLMSAVGDLKQLLTMIMDESKQVASCDASALMLYDEETDELYFEVALGSAADAVKEIRLKADEGIAGACAQKRETIVVHDAAKDERHFKKADESSSFETRNLIATPLVRKDKLIGVLEVLNKSEGADFDDDDVQMIEYFADQSAIAIENAMLLEANLRNERLAAVGQAVFGISHYIKNILAGMKGSVSLCEMGMSGNNMDTIKSAWPILKRSQGKISSLVQDMLTYSKDREPEYEKVDPAQMVQEIAEEQSENSKGARAEFHLDADESIGEVMIDVCKVHDGVLNLVVNAIDAVRELPGGEVWLAARPCADDSEFFELVIKDNGVGIPSEIQSKIFEPFFSTKGSKGTGLGLAVTRKVIEEHGGTLILNSELGEGTEFIVQLPKVPPDKPNFNIVNE